MRGIFQILHSSVFHFRNSECGVNGKNVERR